MNENNILELAWSTRLFDCFSDEESCWWGFWCCWLLNGRTIEKLGLGSSFAYAFCLFLVAVSPFVLFFAGYGLLALLWTIFALVLLVYLRASIRTKIRSRFSLGGTSFRDFLAHCFCFCCAICQEARQSNSDPSSQDIDWCFGEPLSALEERHNALNAGLNRTDRSADSTGVSEISKTSKLILFFSITLACLTLSLLVLAGRLQNVLVLALVFVQPIVILYFVYWRSRRQHAMLDFVIKSFACGFWFTTFQSMVIEMVLQALIVITMSPFLGYAATSPTDINENSSRGNFSLLGGITGIRVSSTDGHDEWPNVNVRLSDVVVISGINTSHYNQSVPTLSAPTSYPTLSASYSIEIKRAAMKEHIGIVVIGLLLMSYVVAAGVEESMKHFIVRCCRYPTPLRNPHTVLVYMMAGALGFATAENIEYIFGANSSPIPGTSLLVGELLILLVRVLMPIHVICSVLQATSLSKILFPAIFLHGTFDFVLFLMGAIEFIYETPSLTYEVASLVVAGLITILGAVWAYKSYKMVENRFDRGWERMTQEDAAL